MTQLIMRKIAASAFLLSALIAAAGCGAARPVKYYQLTIPSQGAASADAPPYPVILLLGALKASHLYREDRIVYGSTTEQMGTYEGHRWAEPPTEMIEASLLHTLRSSGRYQSVLPLTSSAHGDFVLRGQLYDFKEVTGNGLIARVSVDFELRDIKSGQTVWTHSYTHDEPVSGKDVPAMVTALNRNVQRADAEIASSLNQYFAAHPPK
ncbi:MAG TPA: ABC-type transport auxiliary lipoprotein family protein [Candidatus Eremiobacteraceae bacterium]|nr:ABC-type transport auxiliary lipoprotein family protein [Candidatus Eremiobacteraceae bacterium]